MHRILSLFFLLLFVSASVVMLAPWQPMMPGNGLDHSWMMVLAHGFRHGWQFGRDLVFTYGPLGFIAPRQFDPGLYWVVLGFWVAFHGTLAFALWALYRGAGLAGALVLTGFTFLTVVHERDGYVFASLVVLFLLARATRDRAGSAMAGAAMVLLTAVLACAGLMKFTYALIGLPVVVLADAVGVVRRPGQGRRLPVLWAVFAGVFLAGYLAAGQELGNLPAFLGGALEIARGYNDAMQTYRDATGEIWSFLVVAVLTGLLVAAAEWARAGRTGGWRGWAEALMALMVTGGVLFMAWKAGFVRHDDGHTQIAWATLALVLVVQAGWVAGTGGIPGRWRVVLEVAGEGGWDGPGRALRLDLRLARRWTAFAAVLLLLVAAAFSIGSYHDPKRPLVGLERLAGTQAALLRSQVQAVRRLLAGGEGARLTQAHRDALAAVRAEKPLPAVEGTVDIFPSDQAALLAAGLDYRPRPVFQSYSVYTPELVERNRAFFLGDRAPDTVLFAVSPIDGRFPALEEGALWPALLSRYDPLRIEHGYLVLRRRAAPRAVTVGRGEERVVGLGEAVEVGGGPVGTPGRRVWAEVDVRPSLAGRLVGFLFKPPVIGLAVTGATGTVKHRLVPALGRAGFLLSPVVDGGAGLAALTVPDGDAGEPVRRVAVTVEADSRWLVDGAVRLRLGELRVEGAAERPLDPELDAALRSRAFLRRLAASHTEGGAAPVLFGADRLLAHAPMRLTLAAPAGAARLGFAYGLRDEAWGGTDGVCFRVSVEGGAQPLFERCLRPRDEPRDRGPQMAAIDLPAGPAALVPATLVFETLPGVTNAWDWSYWSGLEFR